MVLKNIRQHAPSKRSIPGSYPYGRLVVLLGDYKGGGMMIVRCSTAPLMIITLVHLISMRSFHYIFIFGIHRNTKSVRCRVDVSMGG